MGGFELLDLHDFPGQGTALVGVLDSVLGIARATSRAAEYSRFCNSTVPLARLSKRVFTTDEDARADLEVAHFGPSRLETCVARVEAGRSAIMAGPSPRAVLAAPRPSRSTTASRWAACGSPLEAKSPAPARYKLVVGLGGRRRSRTTGTCGSIRRQAETRAAAGRDVSFDELRRPGPRRRSTPAARCCC